MERVERCIEMWGPRFLLWYPDSGSSSLYVFCASERVDIQKKWGVTLMTKSRNLMLMVMLRWISHEEL